MLLVREEILLALRTARDSNKVGHLRINVSEYQRCVKAEGRYPKIVEDWARASMLPQFTTLLPEKEWCAKGIPAKGTLYVRVFEAEQSLAFSMLFPSGLCA